MRGALLILLCTGLAGGCGNRGPLYLPDETPLATAPAPDRGTDSTEGEEDEDEKAREAAIEPSTAPDQP